jgi:hypothetical protein
MGNAFLCCATREPPQDPDATLDEEADAKSSSPPKPEPNIGFIDLDSEKCTPEDSN